jgi:DNA-binding transcriptional MocR family regulator
MVATLVHSGARLWSINALADEFGIDRRTVKKRLDGIAASGEVNGHQAWRLRDVAIAVMGPQSAFAGDPDFLDPDKLEPSDRLKHFQALREKSKWMAEERHLIPASEVEQVVATAFKSLAQSLDTLPDVLERDCAMGPDEVERAIEVVDAAREGLYQQLLEVCSSLYEIDDAGEYS